MDWVFSLGYFAVKEHETSGLFCSVAKSCSKSKRGAVRKYSPLSFSARASPVRQTVPRRTALGNLRIAEGFVYISARCYRAVDFGFYFFRLPVGGSLGLGFLFLWLSFWFLFCLFVGNLNIM